MCVHLCVCLAACLGLVWAWSAPGCLSGPIWACLCLFGPGLGLVWAASQSVCSSWCVGEHSLVSLILYFSGNLATPDFLESLVKCVI